MPHVGKQIIDQFNQGNRLTVPKRELIKHVQAPGSLYRAAVHPREAAKPLHLGQQFGFRSGFRGRRLGAHHSYLGHERVRKGA